jgi:nitrate/TMAO reductase-like tetraheme cytochrome c subunit
MATYPFTLKRLLKYPRAVSIIGLMAIGVFVISKCSDKKDDNPGVIINVLGEKFAGSASCVGCHKDIYEHHVKTAHYLTTRPATAEYIKGSFEPGKNAYFFNASVVVEMEKRNNGFYQVEYFRDQQKKAKRFDIVVGSGTMGQSFLYWSDHKLFQLPITYFTAADTWSNSPGFPDKVVFNRVITSRCLECHATFAKTISEQGVEPERFDSTRMILGVDCEKCHGPAAKHVDFQLAHPNEKKGEFIINPASLTRQQNLDLCASCHGGRLQKTQPSFSFKVGDKLSDFYVVDTTAPKPENIDVHGNQYALMRASKCFRMTQTLTCNTCHNTHQREKGQTELFSQRCMGCHNNGHGSDCKLTKTIGPKITSNCVDCHMPLQPSKAIAVKLQGQEQPVAAMIRSHYVSIYPDETKKILLQLKNNLGQKR